MHKGKVGSKTVENKLKTELSKKQLLKEVSYAN